MIPRYVIVVAGGTGVRMKLAIPKQFIELDGTPILMHTIQTFYTFDKSLIILLVLPQDHLLFWGELCSFHKFTIPHQVVTGGQTRFQSVSNGLSVIPEEGLVAIHDGVRPLVSHATIARCFNEAEKYGNAIPSISIHETVRMLDRDQSQLLNRNFIKIIQTPQVFSCQIIKKGYEQPYQPIFTDDASVVENLGIPIHLVEGNRENIKITEPFDLAMAEWMIHNTKSHSSV